MKKQTQIMLLGISLLLGIFTNANAAQIFDNFGPSPGYKTSGGAIGFLIGPSSYGMINAAGPLFVPSTTAYLNSFDVPIWNINGDEMTTMQFFLAIYDAGDTAPEIIDTYSLTLGPTGSRDAYTLYSNTNPLLNADQGYWLVATSPESVGWLYTTSDDTSAQATSYDGGLHWSTHTSEIGNQLALRVDGSPVPIPGAVWLLSSGLIGLVGIRRRSQSNN